MRISDWSSDVCSSDLHEGVLRVQRVDLGHLGEPQQAVLVVERLRLEAPMLLEGVGAGADLAAAEIEDAQAGLAGAVHDSPVYEVVGGKVPGRPAAAALVGQQPDAETAGGHAGARTAVLHNCTHSVGDADSRQEPHP